MVDRGAAEALHERASQHYLSGEFAEALAAWEELLRLNPADERAQEGTRLSRMMMPEPAADAVFEVDPAAEAQAAHAASPTRAAVLPDPIRQAEGIDFGDLSGMQALQLDRTEEEAIDAALGTLGRAAEPAVPPAPPEAAEENSLADLLGLEIDPVALPAQVEVKESGIAPFQPPTARSAPGTGAAAGAPPAAGELSRRLSELLAQAEAAADAGDLGEAKTLLARVAVLDEDNIAAQALQDRIREKEGESLRQIDDWIVEGVQLFEQGRPTEARANFERVLTVMPDHLEARDYVRRVDEALAAAAAPRVMPPPAPPGAPLPVEEDFLASLTSGAPPDLQGIPLAGTSPRAKAPVAAPVGAPVAPPAPVARRRVSPKVIVGAVVGLAFAGWWFLNSHEPASDIPEGAITGERTGETAAKTSPPPANAAAAATALLPAPPPEGDPRTRVEQAVARQDWAGAIVAYNEILAENPEDVVARAGLMEAAQQYREKKALEEQLVQTRRAFEDGEYEAGLRLLYRMPKELDPAKVEAGKVAGWVNLGIVSLKAGEPDKALASFGEALALRADDADARKLQAFAQEAAGKPKDGAYYARVEAMEFRPLP
ncbi:MAG TPA: tetratricopeptide repeat protein [Candidatus Polarisedimenticolaceae bacterium]|nr:tetratricopeptide repeat protein [Candidatus Polarisedimenticolaceae bacterium]